MNRSSQHVQEGQRARRGAIRPETVLKLMPQIWFLKATLVFPLGTTSHLNRCQRSSILDAAARVYFSIRHWTELTRTASAKSLLLCIPRSCLQAQPLWRIMTTEQNVLQRHWRSHICFRWNNDVNLWERSPFLTVEMCCHWEEFRVTKNISIN